MGGVSAGSVTFLVSSSRAVVVAAVATVLDADSVVVELFTAFTAVSVTTVEATVLTITVGDVEASATGMSAVTVFCVVTTVGVVGFAVGTLFVGRGGVVLADPGGRSLLGGVKTTPGKLPPAPLIGIDGGGGGRNCDDKKFVGSPPLLGLFLPPPPGPSTFAHTCVLDVKCPSLIVTYR